MGIDVAANKKECVMKQSDVGALTSTTFNPILSYSPGYLISNNTLNVHYHGIFLHIHDTVLTFSISTSRITNAGL
jgi:hypothetical protein